MRVVNVVGGESPTRRPESGHATHTIMETPEPNCDRPLTTVPPAVQSCRLLLFVLCIYLFIIISWATIIHTIRLIGALNMYSCHVRSTCGRRIESDAACHYVVPGSEPADLGAVTPVATQTRLGDREVLLSLIHFFCQRPPFPKGLCPPAT